MVKTDAKVKVHPRHADAHYAVFLSALLFFVAMSSSCESENQSTTVSGAPLLRQVQNLQSVIPSTMQIDTHSAMNESRFWQIIDAARTSAGGNEEQMQKELLEKLSAMPPADIIGFEIALRKLIIRANDFKPMALMKIMEGWVTDDPWLYFRCWLVAQGQWVYETALNDPDALADEFSRGQDIDFEGLLYVATKAFSKQTGREEDSTFPRDVAYAQGVDYDAGAQEPTGIDWEPEDLPRLYPRLWAKFQ